MSAACSTATSSSDPDYTVSTVEWKTESDGYRHASTNDSDLCDKYFWYVVNDSQENPLKDTKIVADKVSGKGYSMWGIIFCWQDKNNYYRLVMHTDQRYAIQKVKDGVSSTLVGWLDDSNLNAGKGVDNVIEIKPSSTTGEFKVYINDRISSILSDTDSPYTGGKSGYYVLVGSESAENFPAEPVDAKFKMLNPVVDGPVKQ